MRSPLLLIGVYEKGSAAFCSGNIVVISDHAPNLLDTRGAAVVPAYRGLKIKPNSGVCDYFAWEFVTIWRWG